MCAQMLINAVAHGLFGLRKESELEVDWEKNPLPLLCLAFWLDALPTELSLLYIDSTEFSGVL